MYVQVLYDAETDDSWPDDLLVKGNKESGITVLEFVEQARPSDSLVQIHALLGWYWGATVEAKDIYLISFQLYHIKDSEYCIYLDLGNGKKEHRYWATTENKPVQEGSVIWQAPHFEISEEDEPDPEVRRLLAREHFEGALAKLAEENKERLRVARLERDTGSGAPIWEDIVPIRVFQL